MTPTPKSPSFRTARLCFRKDIDIESSMRSDAPDLRPNGSVRQTVGKNSEMGPVSKWSLDTRMPLAATTTIIGPVSVCGHVVSKSRGRWR